MEEKPLPIIHLTSEKEVIDNFEQVGRDVERILMEMCGKGCYVGKVREGITQKFIISSVFVSDCQMLS